VQRALQKELKAQQQLQSSISAGSGSTVVHAAQQFALSHGIKFLVYTICFLACVGKTLFIVPVSGWLTPLTYTPLRVSHSCSSTRWLLAIDSARMNRTLSASHPHYFVLCVRLLVGAR
jgi:hypothetical protein